MTHLESFQLQNWDISHADEKSGFHVYTLVAQTDEEFKQLPEVEKKEAVVVTVSQKEIKQLIDGFIRNNCT